MSAFDLTQFQMLPAAERLTVAMSLFESYVLTHSKFESLPVSRIDPTESSKFPASLKQVYDWIGKFALKEKSDEAGFMLPFDSNSIEWAMPGVSLPDSWTGREGRSVIAWIPGGPYRWEVDLHQPNSNSVYLIDCDEASPNDCELNPMNLGDFITTFLLSESIQQASLCIRSSYIAKKFLDTTYATNPFWTGSQFPNQIIQYFDWEGILVEKHNDRYCFAADSARFSQLMAIRGKVKGFKILFFMRCEPFSQSERFEISVERVPAFENSGRVTIEVSKLTSYRFWQQFGETVQFDGLLSTLAAASGAASYGSHCLIYDGEDSVQCVRTLRTEVIVSFIESVIERIDSRIQEQCKTIVSSDETQLDGA